MCGIFGIFGVDRDSPADPGLLRGMGRALTHRGPDGGGIHTDGALGMGMRRLSIIDLSTGDQPMANEDGSIWVVFNGEIYNYRELTKELAARGHRFATTSDTEVLLHLYEEHGAQSVERLRGMFAFAIWDGHTRTLFMARDRLGIKPLYYAETSQGVVFGSELKALVQSPWISPRVSPVGLLAFLRFGYVPGPACILEGVATLPPGHSLTLRAGRAMAPRAYWRPTPCFNSGDRRWSEADAVEQLRSLLGDAVRSHLVSDVPLGAFLSGGIDSSAVVATMAREVGEPIQTFSIGFREQAYNELPFARRVAVQYGTRHHELMVGPGDLGLLEEILQAFDEPFADASAIPTYLVSRLARHYVKVVLSGDGGDELFAGYDRYVVDYRRRHLGILGDMGLGGGLRGLSAILPQGTPGKNFLYNLSLPRMERYVDSISLFPPRVLPRLVEPNLLMQEIALQSVLPLPATGLDPVSRLQDFDIRTYLPGDILTKVDRMSMAHSLEARVPLLDHVFVEFACGLPPDFRFRAGDTKYILKHAVEDRVPAEILNRPKQGFAVPLADWFSGTLDGFFHDVLGDGHRLQSLGIRSAWVRELLDMYVTKRRSDHCHQLWALSVLDRSVSGLLTRSKSGLHTEPVGARGCRP
jgi:asparagine synthase (glutamine-hydrolysing)